MRRARLGLYRQDLAARMATTASFTSRIESGQHRSSTEIVRRLAGPGTLGVHAVTGFEFPPEALNSDAGHSIAHAYGPDLWPRYIEPLGPLGSSAGAFHHELRDLPATPDPDPELGLDLDPL